MAYNIDPDAIDNIPDEDLLDIFQSIVNGATTPAESMGFDDPALNSIERMALGYYRAEHYAQASVIYGFILRMSPERASAWRGLGACAQAVKNYEMATEVFRHAVNNAPEDPISKVFLGECLCQLGEKQEGLKILEDIIATGTTDPMTGAYVTRARAIVSADGGIPAKVVLRRKGEELAKSAKQWAEELGVDPPASGPQYDPDREIEWEDIQNNPGLMKLIGELKTAVGEGRLSLAEVGGFTDNELDGAYACACKYAETGQIAQAMRIVGYLIFLDPHKGRYYQLVGICMQRLNHFEPADQYYGMAAALDKDNPMTSVYRGEAKIMSGKIDEGLEMVQSGLVLAEKAPAEHKDLIERAHVLIRQFAA